MSNPSERIQNLALTLARKGGNNKADIAATLQSAISVALIDNLEATDEELTRAALVRARREYERLWKTKGWTRYPDVHGLLTDWTNVGKDIAAA